MVVKVRLIVLLSGCRVNSLQASTAASQSHDARDAWSIEAIVPYQCFPSCFSRTMSLMMGISIIVDVKR